MNPKESPVAFVAVLAGIGAAIGLGRLLASAEPVTARLVVGRMVATAGIGASAGALTLLYPMADPVVHFGVASALASLGTSGIEAILQRWGQKP